MSDCCNCEVDTRALAARQRRVLIAVLTINVVTFAMMLVASWLSGSSALLSGTLDNLGAALAVAAQIAWRLTHLEVPVVETMGVAAVLNLVANSICLCLLMPFRTGDLNMSSAWECSRNDVFEGAAVILTTIAVALLGSAWPDLVVAIVLLVIFLRSAIRVLRGAWRGLHQPPSPARA